VYHTKGNHNFFSIFLHAVSQNHYCPSLISLNAILSMVPTPSDQSSAPPAPPPLPVPSRHEPHPSLSHFKIAEEESGFWKRFQYAEGAFYEASDPGPPVGPLALRTGPYFFYGTLMDPSMLMEILELKEKPTLRPAKIGHYSCKRWGQYPALINGPQGGIV
jgi:hypothetical protein